MTFSSRPVAWREHRRIPRAFAAILESLSLTNPVPPADIPEPEWERLLPVCDQAQLTLPLAKRWAPCTRLERNLRDNAIRVERLREAYLEAAHALDHSGIEFVMLKGFTQWGRYTPDPAVRAQYDLDLYCPPDTVHEACRAIRRLGYEPVTELENFPTDHLPVMIRKTGWQWRGDFYDPEIPVSIDLHFRFWDPRTERFEAPGVEDFWRRRGRERIGGMDVPVLAPADALGYASLHALRHLLRGSLRLFHIYELAYFLHTHTDEKTVWSEWRGHHPPELRRLEAIPFRLAAEWFACRLPEAASEAIDLLPEPVNAWFERYAASPVETLFHPNKHELWLHLALVASSADRRAVIRRRLVPLRMPGPVDAVYVPDEQMGLRRRWLRRARYAKHVLARTAHHARLLPSAAFEGLLWRWRIRSPGRPLLVYLGAAALFQFGIFVFFVLYNLYLLDRGYQESFLGLVTTALTAGSIAGALPAGWLARRAGLGLTLKIAVGGTAAASVLRAVVGGEVPLLVTAFLTGAAIAVWMVSVPPVIAGLTEERMRPFGFSLFFVSGVSLGVLGGIVGGRLPDWFFAAGIAATSVGAKQAALLAGCAGAVTALWPVSRLRFGPPPSDAAPSYRLSPFLHRFLPALALWHLATGAFNPFFNAYFSRHLGASPVEIGEFFSAAQLAQVGAMLLAPLVLRRLGLVNGIVAAQMATAAALVWLGASPVVIIAAFAYAAYAGFQWMSEPGLYSLLMKHVEEPERGGASAWNSLVAFSSQAVAAAAAGAAFARFGYPPVLVALAALAVAAALTLRLLLKRFE